MPDQPADEAPPARPRELGEAVGAKERRKMRARRERDGTIRIGLGMFGVVGWSIAAPTLIGIGLGLWLDRVRPGPFSWTLALMLAGVTLGCLGAWCWIVEERREIDETERETK